MKKRLSIHVSERASEIKIAITPGVRLAVKLRCSPLGVEVDHLALDQTSPERAVITHSIYRLSGPGNFSRNQISKLIAVSAYRRAAYRSPSARVEVTQSSSLHILVASFAVIDALRYAICRCCGLMTPRSTCSLAWQIE